ncbi:hypothetical protein AVEN_172175-1 [Araneus ventricosus]|uniref:Uncharacterized protein n=1 Tax=Araneus ventricosus TaxID=182803 RepID=A0A4Y2JS14_ARAVE|nr:hypothetical protein AVEN_172175-1 [Araneus ventricosus]
MKFVNRYQLSVDGDEAIPFRLHQFPVAVKGHQNTIEETNGIHTKAKSPLYEIENMEKRVTWKVKLREQNRGKQAARTVSVNQRSQSLPVGFRPTTVTVKGKKADESISPIHMSTKSPYTKFKGREVIAGYSTVIIADPSGGNRHKNDGITHKS